MICLNFLTIMKAISKLPIILITLGAFAASTLLCLAEPAGSGLNASLANLYQVSGAESRSISPENFTGEKGAAGMATNGTGRHAASELGRGWKVSPSVGIKAGTTFTLGEIKGPGCINQIWMTPTGNWRHSILRFPIGMMRINPSVECPVGDFFACGLGQYAQIQFLGGLRQSRKRFQLLLANAFSQEGAHHFRKFG